LPKDSRKNLEKALTNSTIPTTPASRLQIDAAQQPGQLGIVQLDALLVVCGRKKLKRASLQPLVPNAKPIAIPKQDLDPIAIAIHEQE
jgi:hypothetical protein